MDVNTLSDVQRAEAIKKTNKAAALSLAPVILAYIVFVLIRTSGGTVGKDLVEELGWDPSQLAMFTSVFSYVYSFANLPGGMLVDRFGAKRLISCSYIFMAIGSLILALSNSYPMMLVARGLMGFGGAVVFSSLSRLIANWTKATAYSSVNSKVMAASKIGTFYAATPLAAMISSMGRRNAVLSIAVAVVVILVAIIILTKEDPASIGLLTVDELEGRAKPAVKKAQNPFKGIGKIITQPMVWLVVIGSVSMNGAINTFITNFGRTMLAKGAGFEGAVPTNIITVNTIAGIISGLLLGAMLRIKGTNSKNMTLLSFGMFILAEAMVAFGFKSLTVTTWSVVYALIGFASSIEVTTIYAMLKTQVTVKNFGTAVGFCNFAAWLFGTSICTTIWGKIIDAEYSAGSFMNAARFQLAVSVVGCICVVLAKDVLLPAFAEKEEQ